MAHNLIRLSEMVWNTPQLITEETFSPILQYLTDRNNHQFVLGKDAPVVAAKKPQKVGGIGELKISGALTYKPVQMMCSEGGTSYQGLLEDAEELIEMGVDTILLVAESGGGQALMCFSTANRLRELADESGTKLVTYIDTVSASACLALTIVADEVIIHPEAITGSIGCVCAILDRSKALADAGLKPIYISSTEGKTPFQADGSFSQKFLDKMQKDVTALGMNFAEHVHKYTGIPVEDVLALDAQMFNAEEALSLGLVNKIMNHQEFARYITKKD
jgi:ClpP class serine protease